MDEALQHLASASGERERAAQCDSASASGPPDPAKIECDSRLGGLLRHSGGLNPRVMKEPILLVFRN
jgi:hypothetical protein